LPKKPFPQTQKICDFHKKATLPAPLFCSLEKPKHSFSRFLKENFHGNTYVTYYYEKKSHIFPVARKRVPVAKFRQL